MRSDIRWSITAVVVALGLSACGEVEPLSPDSPDPVLAQDREALARDRAPDPTRELVITDASVLHSPDESSFDPRHPDGTNKHGAWSFGRLIHNMLPRQDRGHALAASRFVVRWLALWETAQAPNPGARPSEVRQNIRLVVLEPWKLASGCTADPSTDLSCVLDFRKAPFQLDAIVYRPDLRIVSNDGTAIGGEGRFVFQVVGPTLSQTTTGETFVYDPNPTPQKFTVIFEYSLPVGSNADTIDWAQRWHRLGEFPFGKAYAAHLRTLTADFSGPDSDPRRPNGNALNQIRTNEVALLGNRTVSSTLPPQRWELREFHLSAATGQLTPHTVNDEPSRDFDVEPRGVPGGSTLLADWLLANRASVLANTHAFPSSLLGNSTLVGTGFGAWGSGGTFTGSDGRVVDPELRNAFALNTCAGCHRHETDTRHNPSRAASTGTFLHVTDPRALDTADQPADLSTVSLSAFLRNEIAPPSQTLPYGGPRYADFVSLLGTRPYQLCNFVGLRVCSH